MIRIDNPEDLSNYYTETEVDTLLLGYLTLDQTTPQTITGDTPKLDVLKSKTILGTDSDGKIIEGTHQSLAGYVPYTGATGNVDLGTHKATVGGLEVNGTSLFIMPDNTANAFGIGEGTNPYMCIDTTNGSEIIKFGCGLGANDIFTIQPTLITLGRNTDLGTYNLTTTGLATLGSIKSGILYPSADSTTAVGIFKADGTTNVLNVDTTNGNVGIGTTSPGTRLHIQGKATETAGTVLLGVYSDGTLGVGGSIFEAETSSRRGIRLSEVGDLTLPTKAYFSSMSGGATIGLGGVNNTNIFETRNSTGSVTDFVFDAGGGYGGGSRTAGKLFEIQNDGTAKMTVDYDGNVGIGTTAPGEKLEIDGNLFLNGDNDKIYLGAGKDASIYYDATNLVINPKEVGSGILDIAGVLQTDGYNSSDGSAGMTDTRNFDDGDGNAHAVTIKNGLITGWTVTPS
jgi:hypothetical protein